MVHRTLTPIRYASDFRTPVPKRLVYTRQRRLGVVTARAAQVSATPYRTERPGPGGKAISAKVALPANPQNRRVRRRDMILSKSERTANWRAA